MWILFYSTLLFIGLSLSYVSYNQYNKTKTLLQNGKRTTATVVDFVVSQGDDGPVYKPVFEFKDVTGSIRTYTSTIASKPPAYELEEKVKIIYDKKDPDNLKTISFWGLYRWSIIAFMIAAPFLIIGGSYLLYSFYS